MLDLNFNPFPLLTTNRLLLRKITRDDAGEIFKLRSNSNVMQFIDRPLAQTIDDALNLINVIITALENNEAITWAITLKDKPELIGTIGFWRIQKEHYRAEIGYMLSDVYQRKGLIQEAIFVVLNYGFTVMKLHSAEAIINPENTPSMLLLEKNNFIREAHFKENYYYNGKFLDSYVYSLLAPKS